MPRRTATFSACMALAVAALLLAPAAFAQEEILGKIVKVDSGTIVVQRDDGSQVAAQLAPGAGVSFSDSGDRRLFPNPSVADLRLGMGVRMNYNNGVVTNVVVHYVPEGAAAAAPPLTQGQILAPAVGVTPDILKGRITSIRRDGRELTADLGGRVQTFRVDTRDLRNFRTGDTVLLHVEDRSGLRVVTGIEGTRIGTASLGTTALTGQVVSIDRRRRTMTVADSRGRQDVFDVSDRTLLDEVREGDRIRFETAERSDGSRMITRILSNRSYR